MKVLTLLRHAKSSWDDPVARDFDRPLNRRGRLAARAVGREMRACGLQFDCALASPAVRVMETLADVADGYGSAIAPKWDKRIYLASTDMLLDVIREADAACDTLLLVGHNPGMESLALTLTDGGEGPLRRELALKYPTGTLAEIRLAIASWDDIAAGTGELTRFIRPRDLDPALGPDEDSY
jgi:phosphohistidine phosphatase